MRSFPVVDSFAHAPQSRYLFLDFDGVLHTERPPFDLRFADNLCPIVDELGLHIVISSTWRENFQMSDLVAQLGKLGQHVVGMTPVLENDETIALGLCKGRREVEIRIWLEENASPDAEWMAIDDIEFFFFDNCTRLFLTNSYKGLSKSVAKDFARFAKQILNTSQVLA